MIGVHPSLGPHYSSIYDQLVEVQIRTEPAYSTRNIIGYKDNTAITNTADRLNACFQDLIDNTHSPISSDVDVLLTLTIQPSTGFKIYITSIPVFIDGEMYITPTKEIDLDVLFNNNSNAHHNSTFYLYAELIVDNTVDVTVYDTMIVSPSVTQVFIGTATTDTAEVTSLNVQKVSMWADRIHNTVQSPNSIVVANALGKLDHSFFTVPVIDVYPFGSPSIITPNVSQVNRHYVFHTDNGSPITDMYLYVEHNSVEDFPIGSVLSFSQHGLGKVVVDSAPGVIVNCPPDRFPQTRTQFSRAFLKKVATNTWSLSGDLEP
jgi:hypothetical protein